MDNKEKISFIWKKLGGNYSVQTINDPVQNLAVYGIKSEYELNKIKEVLKSLGAKRFRKVKVNINLFILCFKL